METPQNSAVEVLAEAKEMYVQGLSSSSVSIALQKVSIYLPSSNSNLILAVITPHRVLPDTSEILLTSVTAMQNHW